MRIGIYNRYWNTRGGGERYAGVVAEILAQEHRVELLGPEPVDLPGLSSHLGLDLSGAHFRLLPQVSERQLTPLTADYDLLVNSTYLSRLPSQAKRSVYLVLFPQSTWHPALVRLARGLVDAVRPEDLEPVIPIDGFFGQDTSGYRWSRNRARIRINPWAFRDGRTQLLLFVPNGRTLDETLLEVNGTDLSWTIRKNLLTIERLRTDADGPVEVELVSRTFVPSEHGASGDTRELGVRLPTPEELASRGGRLGSLTERIAGRIDGHDRSIPTSYDLLVSISEFTRLWVEKRWGQPSEVLAPPVDTVTFSAPSPESKRKVILSVGRFFHGSHNKKHLEMLQVFRSMVDRGEVPDGWEYHLVGNLHRNRLEDLEYFAELERLAEGYPAKLLIDLDFDHLVQEYRGASIFWHAAGWGENESRQPEKLEHFGLTTCEAMSSGCIPVVIAKAGQLEIVDHGETGFLFSTAQELEDLTRRLIEDHGQPWVREMRARATTAVQRFGRPRFEERMLEIFRGHDLLP